MPFSKEALIGLPLALLAVPQGGAMKTSSSLSCSAVSSRSCNCEDTVKSSVMMSTPQLLSVDLSMARPHKPSFLQVFVRRAEPAQTSITSSSSNATPANLSVGPCGLLQHALRKLSSEFKTSTSVAPRGNDSVTASVMKEKGLFNEGAWASHEVFDLHEVTLCPGL